MLPKSNRIERSGFELIMRSGKRFHSPLFTLYINKSTNQNSKQFAFSVSKKVCKGAVGRNRLRRQGYSVINTTINSIKPGFSYVFMYKKRPKLPTYSEIEHDIQSLLTEGFMLI